MEYFYHQQSEMFSFYRIPKLLFTDEHLKAMSCDAKQLYSILLARMELLQKNRSILERIMAGHPHGHGGRISERNCIAAGNRYAGSDLT